MPPLHLALLGGFRVQRGDATLPASAWQRRSARTLTKLLAASPGHAIHRDQILETLWPDGDVDSSLNSFAKALHAARRAFEPELPPRGSSAYLRLTDGVLALDADHVIVDADRFERLARCAFQTPRVTAYETALRAYGGELLPEDRYEDWSADRRDSLAGLHVELLLALARALEERAAWNRAEELLRTALQHDPAREEAHRRLMRLYAETGDRDRALRQFELCRERLRLEQHVPPAKETTALYDDVLADRIQRRTRTPPVSLELRARRRLAAPELAPFVGRDSTLAYLHDQLDRADEGNGGMVLVTGEPGIGKTRLVAEFAASAGRHGACVLRGGGATRSAHPAYGPIAVALESYAASLPAAERRRLARRYPALGLLVPSLETGDRRAARTGRTGHGRGHGRSAIVRVLSHLARPRPVLIVLGDVHDSHRTTLDLLEYLAHLAAQRRWLLVGVVHEERLEADSEVRRRIGAMVRERLCARIELPRLDRRACDDLVRALLEGVPPDDATLDHVFDRSLGNPLFVEELVREMRQRAVGMPRHVSWEGPSAHAPAVPAGVRALVQTQVTSLAAPVRRALALVAAAETEISLADLRAAADALRPPVAAATLFEALDTALTTRMLEERRDGYAFRHPLVRAAVYEGLSRHRRDELRAALGRSEARTPTHGLRAAAG